MISLLFGFQIFIIALISLIIVFQKSSSDGIVVSNNNAKHPTDSSNSFITKITIFLIFIFMANSLILAKNSMQGNKNDSSIIKSLEDGENFGKSEQIPGDDIPKLE